MIPLVLAARIAYEELTPEEARVSGEAAIAEVVPLVAAALASVSVVLYRASREQPLEAVRADELDRVLRALRDDSRSDWDAAYFLRREDFYDSLRALKRAGWPG